MVEIENRVKRYIGQTVFFGALTGLLVALTLQLLGVDFAWVFGFLAFLLNFIPSVGEVVATLFAPAHRPAQPQPVEDRDGPGHRPPRAIEFVMGNLIQPEVQGGSLNLHPVIMLMSLIFFGMIWGIVGDFLATPIAGTSRSSSNASK